MTSKQPKTSKKTHKTRITNKRRNEIQEELRILVESGKILGETHTMLAERFNVKRDTISRYLKQIYSKIPAEDIEHTRVKIQVMFDKLFRESEKMLATAKNNKEKKEAIDLLLRCMDKFIDFLERFGIKAKAPDLHYMKGDIDNNINIQVITTEQNE